MESTIVTASIIGVGFVLVLSLIKISNSARKEKTIDDMLKDKANEMITSEDIDLFKNYLFDQLDSLSE
jgi:hypothetical protein